MRAALLLALCVSQWACIPSTAIVPVTATNADQVNACKTDAVEHNDFVFGGMASGGIGAGLGAVAATQASNQGLMQGLAIGAAAAGVVTGIAAGGAGLTGSAFANSQCSNVVGPLPAKPAPAAQDSVDRAIARAVRADEMSVAVIRTAGGGR